MFTFNLNRDKWEIDIDEKIFIIPEFFSLWKYDKTKNKKWAKRTFLYIWIAFDISIDNDYRDMSRDLRIKEASKIAFGKDEVSFTEKENELILMAVEKYIMLSSSSEERLLNTLKEHIDEQNDILGNIKSIKDDGELDASYGKRLKLVLENIKSLVERKKELENIIKNDDGIIRGGKSESMLEKGDLAVKSKYNGK